MSPAKLPNLRSFTILALVLSAGAAHAQAAESLASGIATSQWDVLRMGAGVSYSTYFQYSNYAVLSTWALGGFAVGDPEPTNFWVSGEADVFAGLDGSALEVSSAEEDIFFTNNSSTEESVTVGWQGSASSSSVPSYAFSDYQSWNVTEAYFEVNGSLYSANAYSFWDGATTASNSAKHVFTLDLPAGSQLQVVAGGYSESYGLVGQVSTPTPGPAAVAPFLVGLVTMLRRRAAGR